MKLNQHIITEEDLSKGKKVGRADRYPDMREKWDSNRKKFNPEKRTARTIRSYFKNTLSGKASMYVSKKTINALRNLKEKYQ